VNTDRKNPHQRARSLQYQARKTLTSIEQNLWEFAANSHARDKSQLSIYSERLQSLRAVNPNSPLVQSLEALTERLKKSIEDAEKRYPALKTKME